MQGIDTTGVSPAPRGAVTLVCSSSDPSGVATHVYHLATLLHTRGLLAEVICAGAGWLVEALRRQGVECTGLGRGNLWRQLIRGQLRLLHSPRPGIVHAHGRFSALAALPVTWLSGRVRLLVTVHQFRNLNGSPRESLLNWLEARASRAAEKLVCVSEALKNEMVRSDKQLERQARVIPNWIEPYDRAGPAPGPDGEQPFRLCAAGRLRREKGFDLLLAALGRLRRRGCEVPCDIYGEGPDGDHLRQLCRLNQLEASVRFPGAVQDFSAVIGRYSGLVVPSRRESFGFVVLEAYRAGVPVICSDVAGLGEVLRPNDSALVFPSEDDGALAGQIARLYRNAALRRRLAESAHEFGRRFTLTPELTGQLLDLYGTH